MSGQKNPVSYSLKESDFLAFQNPQQTQEQQQQRVKFLQSPRGIIRPDASRDVSPVQMTQSYFQDSDQKSQIPNSYSARTNIITTTITNKLTGINTNQQQQIQQQSQQQPEQQQQQQQPQQYQLNSSSSNNRFNYQASNYNNVNQTYANTNTLTVPQTRAFSSDVRILNTPKYESKAMTIQEMNVSQLQESSRSKKLLDLENSLQKEKNAISALQVEKEYISNKLKENDSKFSPYSSQFHGYSSIQSVQHSKDEVSRLYTLCKEKDQIIASLMDDLAGKPSREAAEADRGLWLNQIQNFKNSIIELENKIVLLTTENERLNRKVTDKEFDIQKKNSESAFNEEKLKIEMEEMIQNYEERLNKLIMENEKIAMINESLRSKLEQQQTSFESREKQFSEQSESIRSYWKEHFQRELQEHKASVEAEKGVFESQLKHSRSLTSDLDQKIRTYLTEIQQLNQAILEKDSLLQEFQVQLSILDKKRGELAETTNQLQETKKSQSQLEQRLAFTVSDNTKLQSTIEGYKLEIETWKIKQAQTEERLQRSLQTAIAKSEEYGEKALRQERERFEYELMMKEEEKIGLLMKVVLVTAENEKSHNQIISQMRIIDDLHFEIRQREQKYKLLEADQNILIDRNEDLQKKIEQLIVNIDELNAGLKARIEEVEIWRAKLSDMQIEWESKLSRCEAEKTNLMQRHAQDLEAQRVDGEEKVKRARSKSMIEYEQKCSNLAALQRELEESHRQLSILDRKYASLKSERDAQQQLLLEKITLSEELAQSLRECKVELERINSIKMDLQHENDNYRQRLQNLDSTNNRLVEEFNRKIKGKDEELEDIRRDRSIKIVEIESLQSRLASIEGEVDKRKAVYSDLQNKFNQLIDENEKLLHIAADCEMMREELGQMDSLRGELQRLEKELQEQNYQHSQKINSLQEDLAAAESRRQIMQEQHAQQKEEMQIAHQNEIEDIKLMLQRDFDMQFNSHSSQLKMVIADHEKEISVLKVEVEKLLTDLSIERCKVGRIIADLDKANRDVDIWRSKAGQIDPNHPYIIEMSSQLEIKRRECLEYQTRIHEIERRRNELERVIVTRRTARTPSVDTFKQQQQQVILVDRPILNLGILEENDKLNRMVLNRCREIVHQKY